MTVIIVGLGYTAGSRLLRLGWVNEFEITAMKLFNGQEE